MFEIDQDVLIVGASVAGLSTAEALRRGGHRGRLTLLDAESRDPYDRPPLSKQVLSGRWEVSKTALRSRGSSRAWARNGSWVTVPNTSRPGSGPCAHPPAGF